MQYPVLLLHCHWHLMYVAGITVATVPMQKTLSRVLDANAVKSLDVVRGCLAVCYLV